MRAYKTYVRPIMESGVAVFNPFKKKDIDLLESVQDGFTRKVVMRCFRMKYTQVPNGTARSKLLGLPTLCSRRKKADLIVMFKILSKKLSLNPVEFFGVPLTRTRSGRLRLHVPVARTQVRANFLTYRNVRELNSMLSENDKLIGLYLQAFKSFISRRM